MKKIIAIVAVIATITACFCIGANAYEKTDYYGLTINNGTEITFKDIINVPDNANMDISFLSLNSTYYYIQYENGKLVYRQTTTYKSNAYDYNTQTWADTRYKTIKLNQDIVLSDNALSNFIIENAISGLPEIPPKPLEGVLEKTNATFTTTLTVATAIIAWLMANQIALVGLYMYILIALVATGKRFIMGV